MAKVNNDGMALLRQHGESTWWGSSMWRHPFIVRDAICEDGKRRTVRLNQEADTFFSWPGRATIGGKTVRGFVTTKESEAYNVVETFFIQIRKD